MSRGTVTKPVDITNVKKHHSCFGPMKDCVFIDYRINNECDVHITIYLNVDLRYKQVTEYLLPYGT